MDVGDLVYVYAKLQKHIDKQGKSAVVLVELWVKPDGVIEDCSVEQFTGNENTAHRLCPVLVGRNIGVPTDAEGHAIYGLTSSGILLAPDRATAKRKELSAWLISTYKTRFGPVPSIVSSRKGAGDNVLIKFVVSENGQPNSCETVKKAQRDLAALACEQAAKMQFPIRRNAEGTAVSYARMEKVGIIDEETPSGNP